MHPEIRLEETVERFRQGDPAAFETLYRLESLRLGRFIRRYARSEDLTEDLFQEVWIRAWRKRAQLHDAARFIPWLYQIARHCIISHMRKNRQKLQVRVFGDFDSDGTNEDWLARQPDGRAGPRTLVARRQWMEHVDTQLDQLDPQAAEMLAMRYGAGLTLREIADTLNLPLGTVCAKVSRTLIKLRGRLQENGLEWEAL